MIDKTIVKESSDLLILAQKVFGDDLVIRAYVTTYNRKEEYKNEIPGELIEAEKEIKDKNKDINEKSLIYDSQDILLEFANGKTIHFWTSEWAGAQLLTDDEIIEVKDN